TAFDGIMPLIRTSQGRPVTTAIPLLICDDSSMARKQLIRSLPANWPFQISHAENGLLGLEAILAGKGDIVLLDLTMPELDGFGVLTRMREENLQAEVIVISGDVQDEAIRRALALGARSFIRKPADPDALEAALLALDKGLATAAEAVQPETSAPP